MRYYKFLNEDNQSWSGGQFDWADCLPKDGQPGEWTPAVDGALSICERGYHCVTSEHLIDWINANLYEMEIDPEYIEGENKIATRRIRLLRKVEIWNERSQRLFACWCVRQIWHLLTDERSRNAVEVAERYANGGATKEELDAAWGAAWAAARAAAWDAAWASARDAARDAAWGAARDVARAAALAAALGAARAAAWGAARDSQNKHLVEMLELA